MEKMYQRLLDGAQGGVAKVAVTALIVAAFAGGAAAQATDDPRERLFWVLGAAGAGVCIALLLLWKDRHVQRRRARGATGPAPAERTMVGLHLTFSIVGGVALLLGAVVGVEKGVEMFRKLLPAGAEPAVAAPAAPPPVEPLPKVITLDGSKLSEKAKAEQAKEPGKDKGKRKKGDGSIVVKPSRPQRDANPQGRPEDRPRRRSTPLSPGRHRQ